MSKKQAVRLSEKKLHKDRTWMVVTMILATVLCLLSVMRTFDSDKVAFESDGTPAASCGKLMNPLAAYATGAGIDAAIIAAEEGQAITCN
ncbi:hypothetical protein H8Z72_23365 (plasmid) [Xanthomonas citri pv. citri]|uniref:hypothetical protein n=1 Tax=Xanthomonas citri TaxID=346 RepID=UPI001932AA64|nr:hypothetical protein [Xanthomonas citri]QRD62746.1 hypothetical protein H8Z74_22820 [Xanthomonas citri pv. citri]QRD67073.1 hypothetical protein H8Z73_22905 [Xanthomonas citri pv. citri]QRD71674.1 hypothetical protein H8Z72_23365 [Xanthomonas citri pv. citri]